MTHDVAFIGISPGNSYFKAGRLAQLFTETVKRHGVAVVSVMDRPSVFTNLALGKSFDDATAKAKKQGHEIQRRITKGLEQTDSGVRNSVRILDWASDVHSHPAYLQARHKLHALYKTNEPFRRAVDDAARAVLLNQRTNSSPPVTEQDLKVAGRYLVNELALCDSAAEILNTDAIHYYYHRDWPVYEQFIAGAFDGRPRPEQQFHVLTFA